MTTETRAAALLIALLLAPSAQAGTAGIPVPGALPHLEASGMVFRFDVTDGRLQPISLLPAGVSADWPTKRPLSPAVAEVAVQVTGRNWKEHHAKKLIGGSPGTALIYDGQWDEPSPGGHHSVLRLHAAEPRIDVESHYQFFNGVPVVRRWTRLVNRGSEPAGIEHASSAMLYGLADLGNRSLEDQIRIHYAFNSWKSEAQWQSVPPSRLGLSDTGEFNLNAISFSNLGSWSTMWFLPMGVVENRELGVTWFWQIEHNGAWHWELSNTSDRNVYLYLGGPDALYSQAWKQLQPGAGYETTPVALGCVRGGFAEAIAALTAYRRQACLQPHADNANCPVIFNDYMNCLMGDPTTEKELPLIDAAAQAGCEYFVIDAGWYAELNESWWEAVGLWQPSKTRWGAGGMQAVLDHIRARGMTPGLWLEIEVAGIRSPLKDKPDAWFFRRHGQRVIDNGRYLLDFRNPEVRAHADSVVNRVVNDYGVGYIKMDYNVDAQLGTETDADSAGQGLLEHQRAYLRWIDTVRARFPRLVIENCSSGGGRMDYAMLSHHQLQSSSDQTDYRKYPAIVAGGLAAVLPEQIAVWSYPKRDGDADEASFNMVNAMLGRIHQSGHLAKLRPESLRQVQAGLRLYKERIRPRLPRTTPFFPLGMPSMADEKSPVAVGVRDSEGAFVAVWRLAGASEVTLPRGVAQGARLIYPTDLGIAVDEAGDRIRITFPRPFMAAILEVPADPKASAL